MRDKENSTMRELHEIRENIGKELKSLSKKEKFEVVNKEALDFIKKKGISKKTKKSA